jgi:hypothetical protein
MSEKSDQTDQGEHTTLWNYGHIDKQHWTAVHKYRIRKIYESIWNFTHYVIAVTPAIQWSCGKSCTDREKHNSQMSGSKR